MTDNEVYAALKLLRHYGKEALAETNKKFFGDCADVVEAQQKEIVELRTALETLHNCVLRMCCRIKSDNKATVNEVVHVERSKWNEAFAPLRVPPYNRLRWEKPL